MPSRFDGQAFSDEYLTRPPGNYCLVCGKKLVVSPSQRWAYMYVNDRFIGYSHEGCQIDGDDKAPCHGSP